MRVYARVRVCVSILIAHICAQKHEHSSFFFLTCAHVAVKHGVSIVTKQDVPVMTLLMPSQEAASGWVHNMLLVSINRVFLMLMFFWFQFFFCCIYLSIFPLFCAKLFLLYIL